jgi:hypothetical protein
MLKEKPAIYHTHLNAWGWVHLKELAEIIGWSPWKVWKTLFDLTKRGERLEIIVPALGNEALYPTNRDGFAHGILDGSAREQIESGKVYVPARWALDALEALRNPLVTLICRVHGEVTVRTTAEIPQCHCGLHPKEVLKVEKYIRD